MPQKIYPLQLPAGIQRDGTIFSASGYIDGQWCRFYRGLPQKMGGYVQILGGLDNIIRGTYVVPNSPNFNIYSGDYQSLKYIQVDGNGNALGAQVDRTPALFNANVYNLWSFEIMFSTIDTSSILIAHAAQNLFSIDQTVEAPVYYGDTLSTSPLIETGQSVSGGVVVLHPFLFYFGNSGDVRWSMANDPTVIMDDARVTGSKIVAGLATRGGNSSPAGLLWSLDSLIRVTQVGTTSIEFKFDTVTGESSILSSKSVIEYDGIYYWAGVDRFLVYNGIVQELPNSFNLQYFFGNLNYAQRQKVWATKVTKWGEIWWFFPGRDVNGNFVDECNFAVIYNIREQKWYDTMINRSSGWFDQTFTRPVWTDSAVDGSGKYIIWKHESGNDKVVGATYTAIESYFETQALAWIATGPDGQMHATDRLVDFERFEPDFLQTGSMELTVKGKAYANSVDVISSPYTFNTTTEKINCREQRREMTLKISSNVEGGYYQMGKPMIVTNVGDVRP